MDARIPSSPASYRRSCFQPARCRCWSRPSARDLHSYSLGSLVISNLGNLVHAVYVYSLPFGPIWLLHGFYLLTSGLMLAGYLLFERGGC